MKIFVDMNGDRHYLVTDDGEAVYVDELEEDGRDTELLEQTIDAARRRRYARSASALGSLESETYEPD